jgi:hypothetical protein
MLDFGMALALTVAGQRRIFTVFPYILSRNVFVTQRKTLATVTAGFVYRGNVSPRQRELVEMFVRLHLVVQAALFRSAKSHDAVNRVSRTLGWRCMEVPHLQFAEQANAEQLNSGDEKYAGDDEDRPMEVHHILMGKDLQPQQPDA